MTTAFVYTNFGWQWSAGSAVILAPDRQTADRLFTERVSHENYGNPKVAENWLKDAEVQEVEVTQGLTCILHLDDANF